MHTKIHILSTLAGLLLLWRFYCFPILFVVVRGSQFCASNIACCVGIVHLETEERWVFLPTGSITATVLSASSPLFVSDELLKPADQFEYPSNISMSRTCVYSPRKIYFCNMFCLIYSRWVIPIELIKFQKPTKSCRSSCCFHLHWNARRISEHPGRVWSWEFDEMPSNVGTDNKMHWPETLEFTW